MKYGIREICDVVFRAKAKMTVGNKVFYKDEPVMRFDTLKTSTLEGATTTVYAQGGKGNSRLMGWDGEKTVTFTMEDALISTESLAVLTGANVVTSDNLGSDEYFAQHITFDAITGENGKIELPKECYEVNGSTKTPLVLDYSEDNQRFNIYVMITDDKGNPISEPYLYQLSGASIEIVEDQDAIDGTTYKAKKIDKGTNVMVDCYIKKTKNVTVFNITADSFSGNFYIEGNTLFRNQNGIDDPAEFIIPNGKVQSNFTFQLSSTGDPSTFTFTVDAFPDFLKHYYNNSVKEKVYSSIQLFANDGVTDESIRTATPHDSTEND